MAAEFSPQGAPAPADDARRFADALAPYVPPLVLTLLMESGAPTTEASAWQFEGAVLFTDIAGFTTLTERMDEAGPAGVEELSRLLNAYFTDLISLVEAHGGLVLKFAGDALMAVWIAREGLLPETTHRVGQCALLIQKAMGAYRVTDEVTLSMRVSIGAGVIHHMVLGGAADRWASRLAGAAMAEARHAISLAKPGEAVLAPEAARLLASIASTAPRGKEAAQLIRIAPIPAQPLESRLGSIEHVEDLLPHVPFPVRGRVLAGQAGWIAEFRRVTVLFVNVPEVDDVRPSDMRRAQAVVCVIQNVLERFRGVVDNLGDDQDGLTLIAAFGLPERSHEDDAVRAVRSALLIRRDLRDMGLGSWIGVTTGRLFCGAIGSAGRRSYSMVGDAMNRCARLMRLAENDIFCDDPTRVAASRSIQFEYLRDATLRGKASAVAIYRPLAEHAAAASGAEGIVGRESEREWIRARLTALRERGEGGVITIEGDAGIGKSTLLADLKGGAADLGLRLFAGGGDSLERTSSYHAWPAIFRAAIDSAPDADDAVLMELLTARFSGNPEAMRLAPLLNPAIGMRIPENEITSQMTAQSRAEAAMAMLGQLLREVTDATPAVVVLEDAHWLDSASWALALELHRKTPRLLLVLATRPLPAPEPEPWKALRHAAGAGRLQLGPLLGKDILTLVRRRLGIDALPPHAGELIIEKGEGHPFFSEELGYALRDAGHLVIKGRACALAPGIRDLRRLNFPVTVQGAVSERIDRLSPREQLAIKVASVNGRAFSLRTLRAIHPVQPDHEHLAACMDRLVTLDLTVRASSETGPAFQFKHNIIQEVAYEQLIFSQRQQLHRRLAEYLEETDAGNYPLLAHHWRNAGAPKKAIRYLDLAGDQALQRFANREAVEFLQQAIQISPELAEKPATLDFGRWHRQIGEAYHHLGLLAQSREWLSQATRIFGYPVPNEHRLRALALPGSAIRQVWRRLLRSGRAPRENVDAASLLEAIHAYNQLAEIAYFANDLLTSVFCCIHGLNLAEALGPSPKLAEMYASMMIVTSAIPPLALGRMYFRLTEKALSGFDQPATQACVREFMGIYLSGLGMFREAREHLAAACDVFLLYGNGRRLEECLTNFVYSHLHRGELAEAEEMLSRLRRSAQRREDAQTTGWARMLQAELLLPIRGPDAALAALGENETPGWDALTRAAFHAISAQALFRLGRIEAARERAATALEQLAGTPPVSYTTILYVSYLVEVCLELFAHALGAGAPTAELRIQARRACGVMRRFGRAFPVGLPRAHLWEGRGQWLLGRKKAADRSWQKALAASQSLGMKRDLALVHMHLAMLHGESHKDTAIALFEEIGAHSELAHWRTVAWEKG
jgi:class 3 adenylate cyclase/tetratricopeptide (TPR) repeat protein